MISSKFVLLEVMEFLSRSTTIYIQYILLQIAGLSWYVLQILGISEDNHSTGGEHYI
jgi:inner membrane protein involved in colicin E2 resistance